MSKIRVTMLENAYILGTSMVFNKGEAYDAFPATNQPDYEARKLYFVLHPNGDSALLTADDECMSIISQQ